MNWIDEQMGLDSDSGGSFDEEIDAIFDEMGNSDVNFASRAPGG